MWDGKVLLVPGFLSEDERQGLFDWSVNAAQRRDGFVLGIIRDHERGGVARTDKRVTSRFNEEGLSTVKYPDLAYRIQDKILDTIPSLKGLSRIEFGGVDGLVVSVTYDSGDVYEHLDPAHKDHPTVAGLRCNVLVSKPESGGTIWIDGKPYEVNAGDLHCYLVTHYRHRVDVCHGNVPRVLFMYGWWVNASGWKSGQCSGN